MKQLCAFAFFGMVAATIGSQPMIAVHQTSVAVISKSSDSGIYILRLDPTLDDLIVPGSTIERVATGFTFTESPMWREGRLWFSDVRGDKLRAATPDGKIELLLDNSGGVKNKTPGLDQGSDGMAPDKDGSVLACPPGGVCDERERKLAVLYQRWE